VLPVLQNIRNLHTRTSQHIHTRTYIHTPNKALKLSYIGKVFHYILYFSLLQQMTIICLERFLLSAIFGRFLAVFVSFAVPLINALPSLGRYSRSLDACDLYQLFFPPSPAPAGRQLSGNDRLPWFALRFTRRCTEDKPKYETLRIRLENWPAAVLSLR